MGLSDEKLARRLLHMEAHSTRYIILFVGLYIFLNNSLNAWSEWTEMNREGQSHFDIWEPFTWEYSSALATLLILPFVLLILRAMDNRLTTLWQQVLAHFGLASLFAVLHVTLMVLIRKAVYFMAGGHYDFGPVVREFFYEYRKDIWGYLFFVSLFYIIGFLLRRIKGEASLVSQLEDNQIKASPRHFLVKKLDQAFLVKTEDICWLEAAGNYVTLHAGGRMYPLRTTLSALTERLTDQHFVRVHRSHSVNLDHIASMSFEDSGDGKITLKNGAIVPLSRRYKTVLDDALL